VCACVRACVCVVVGATLVGVDDGRWRCSTTDADACTGVNHSSHAARFASLCLFVCLSVSVFLSLLSLLLISRLSGIPTNVSTQQSWTWGSLFRELLITWIYVVGFEQCFKTVCSLWSRNVVDMQHVKNTCSFTDLPLGNAA